MGRGCTGTRPAVEGDVVMADTGENPQRREQGPRPEQMERRSTGAQTSVDEAAGQQNAWRDVGTANSAG